ncbi:hypothetical protein [Sporisorium scitamineum]|uniref:Secreted protein n=1 Tax=Sporisorium scitamineum TaxID=49012 RepID=A0A0F7S1H6_9BASI|nr:hypothetical protein [Sporisorium scitamineum]
MCATAIFAIVISFTTQVLSPTSHTILQAVTRIAATSRTQCPCATSLRGASQDTLAAAASCDATSSTCEYCHVSVP